MKNGQLDDYAQTIKRLLRYEPEALIKRGAKSLNRILDEITSLTIRIRDGFKCFTCESTDEEIMGVGHLLRRGLWPVRWFEMNLYCQCDHCNGKHEYDPRPYRLKWMQLNGGPEGYDALETKAYSQDKLSLTYKAGLLAHWQGRLREELAIAGRSDLCQR